MKPLYGHTSEATAYVVDDYPYGYTLRCKIRYWLEWNHGKGYRFVSQTTNPKKAGEVWNKPKKSTYVGIAACMYLDEKEHVHWTGLGIHSNKESVQKFLESFPEAPGASTARKLLEHIQ